MLRLVSLPIFSLVYPNLSHLVLEKFLSSVNPRNRQLNQFLHPLEQQDL